MNIQKTSAIILNTFCVSIQNPKKVRIFATTFGIKAARLVRKARQGIQTLILNALSFLSKSPYICSIIISSPKRQLLKKFRCSDFRLNAFSFFIQKFYICELERKLFFQIVEMRSRYPDSQQGTFLFCTTTIRDKTPSF